MTKEQDQWTDADATAAAAQGWNLYEVWEGKIEWVVQKVDSSSLLSTDEAARIYVAHRAKNNDALAAKAIRIAFNSRMPRYEDVAKRRRKA